MNAHDLDTIVARHDLNEHPFYRAWRAGTLPASKLLSYASEYTPFIESLEGGWRCLGEHAHAAEEREHARLWGQFREALGAAREASCPEAQALLGETHEAFADPVTALGALYAIECQQPSTTRSKLDGLREHYDVGEGATAYFRIHADDYTEREHLRGLAARLAPSDYARAAGACERACMAMWSALDGIMGECQGS
jgi:pyrroloquinoline-quinone synthase